MSCNCYNVPCTCPGTVELARANELLQIIAETLLHTCIGKMAERRRLELLKTAKGK